MEGIHAHTLWVNSKIFPSSQLKEVLLVLPSSVCSDPCGKLFRFGVLHEEETELQLGLVLVIEYPSDALFSAFVDEIRLRDDTDGSVSGLVKLGELVGESARQGHCWPAPRQNYRPRAVKVKIDEILNQLDIVITFIVDGNQAREVHHCQMEIDISSHLDTEDV